MSKRPTVERNFQAKLIKELRTKYPDDIIFKNDAVQGIPDILILHGNTWASLECKRSESAPHRPNQDYYVDKMDRMSFSRFIYPENKEEVLHELEQALEVGRGPRLSRRKQEQLVELRRRRKAG